MNRLEKPLWSNHFSHIYIERDAEDYPITKEILSKFPKATKIKINHYKDIFCRPNQSFRIQKNSQKLILAVKRDNLIYKGAEVCQDFGNKYFYYTSLIMNCIYDCDYCYLQGMYPSSNIVVFVNIKDYFRQVDGLLEEHPVYLSISYDSDLLAFENIVPFVGMWIEYARKRENLKIEVRTKSLGYSAIRHMKPSNNVILAFTLSPQEVINKYEHKTPSLDARLRSIREAMDDGWTIRLCFDPILLIPGYKEHYRLCIKKTFLELESDKVQDISIGVFRIGKDYMKRMKKDKGDCHLLYYPFECINGVYSYPKHKSYEMTEFIKDIISQYISHEKIYLWE